MSAGILLSIVVAATDPATPDPDTVTPGIIGFIVTFLVAVATLGLVVDMVRRVRRVNYRAQVREELEAELAAQTAGAGAGGSAASGSAASGSAAPGSAAATGGSSAGSSGEGPTARDGIE